MLPSTCHPVTIAAQEPVLARCSDYRGSTGTKRTSFFAVEVCISMIKIEVRDRYSSKARFGHDESFARTIAQTFRRRHHSRTGHSIRNVALSLVLRGVSMLAVRDLQHWYCTASCYSEGRRSIGLVTSRSKSVATLQCDLSRAGAPAP
jgi:hypothetical protein